MLKYLRRSEGPKRIAIIPNTMWLVYIIECSDSRLYTGITNNLKRRIAAHNSGNGGRFTKFRGPVKLVYCKDAESRSEALKRESDIKKLSRDEKLEMIRSFGSSHTVGASGQFLA